MKNFVPGALVIVLLASWVPGSNGGLEFLAAMLGFTDKDNCPKNDIRCGSGECILEKWRCDSQVDCKDGSDEVNCPPPNCTTREFLCDKVRCLPIDYRCDGESDCKDRTDEHADTCVKPCPEDNFRCSDGKCIPLHWRCDKEKDCKTGDDESDSICKKECLPHEWACSSGSQCIAKNRRCDSTTDCSDASDESMFECKNSSADISKCSGTNWSCLDGRCIPERWLCDGNRDCSQGEDEKLPQCTNSGVGVILLEEKRAQSDACLSADFVCNNGECIPKNWVCDGSVDCEDESDELQCAGSSSSSKTGSKVTAGCPETHVACPGKNGSMNCLPLEKLCDKQLDCIDGSDEGGQCQHACLYNGQCSHTCRATPVGPVCTCPNGYFLSEDKKACDEKNHCTGDGSLSGPCGHYCHSVRGSFKCTCAPGFRLEPDNRTCKPTGQAYIGYALGAQVKWFGVNLQGDGILISGGQEQIMTGLDFHDVNNTSKVFVTDSFRGDILISEGNPAREKTILDKLSLPEGLAYDWVSENLYYTDTEKPEIGVCAVGGSEFYCTVLIGQDRLDSPRGIAVHPARRFLFFSQWKKVSVIERVLLDGTARKAIITTKIVWPNSLTIDYIHDRLYWLDAHNKWIESSTFDGTDRRVVIHQKDSHPFALTILGNRLFWSDWYFRSISSVLTNGKDFQTARSTGKTQPMAVVAIHSSRQMPVSSPCQRINGASPCEQICLAISNASFVCACKSGYQLSDSSKCVQVTVGATVPSRYPSAKSIGLEHIRTEHACLNSADCTCEGPERTHPHDPCVCMSNRCHLITSRPIEQRHPSRVLPHPYISASSLQNSDHSASTLAGIVCASLLAVVVVVILIYLFRKYCMMPENESDVKNLLDADPETPPKKPLRCPSVLGGFTNPVYENVTPSNYMVRFYKNRRSCSSERVPDTPASNCTP